MSPKYYLMVLESISERGSCPSCVHRIKFLFLTISFFLIGSPGARKHHTNSSLTGFIYKSVIFMEPVETDFLLFFSMLAMEKST